VVCAQLQGTPQRRASASRCTNTRLLERAKPKSFAQDGLGSKTQVPCFGCLLLPDIHMGEDGSPNQAERWLVESRALVSTASPNTTHLLLVTAMARDCCL
jgi:hypothetical protein